MVEECMRMPGSCMQQCFDRAPAAMQSAADQEAHRFSTEILPAAMNRMLRMKPVAPAKMPSPTEPIA